MGEVIVEDTKILVIFFQHAKGLGGAAIPYFCVGGRGEKCEGLWLFDTCVGGGAKNVTLSYFFFIAKALGA